MSGTFFSVYEYRVCGCLILYSRILCGIRILSQNIVGQNFLYFSTQSSHRTTFLSSSLRIYPLPSPAAGPLSSMSFVSLVNLKGDTFQTLQKNAKIAKEKASGWSSKTFYKGQRKRQENRCTLTLRYIKFRYVQVTRILQNKIFIEKHLHFRVEMDGNDVCQIPVRVRSALWEFDKGKG